MKKVKTNLDSFQGIQRLEYKNYMRDQEKLNYTNNLDTSVLDRKYLKSSIEFSNFSKSIVKDSNLDIYKSIYSESNATPIDLPKIRNNRDKSNEKYNPSKIRFDFWNKSQFNMHNKTPQPASPKLKLYHSINYNKYKTSKKKKNNNEIDLTSKEYSKFNHKILSKIDKTLIKQFGEFEIPPKIDSPNVLPVFDKRRLLMNINSFLKRKQNIDEELTQSNYERIIDELIVDEVNNYSDFRKNSHNQFLTFLINSMNFHEDADTDEVRENILWCKKVLKNPSYLSPDHEVQDKIVSIIRKKYGRFLDLKSI